MEVTKVQTTTRTGKPKVVWMLGTLTFPSKKLATQTLEFINERLNQASTTSQASPQVQQRSEEFNSTTVECNDGVGSNECGTLRSTDVTEDRCTGVVQTTDGQCSSKSAIKTELSAIVSELLQLNEDIGVGVRKQHELVLDQHELVLRNAAVAHVAIGIAKQVTEGTPFKPLNQDGTSRTPRRLEPQTVEVAARKAEALPWGGAMPIMKTLRFEVD